MDIGSILVIIAIMLLVALYISQPFFEREVTASNEESEYSHLLEERERLLGRIEELDFDYELGKILESDYQRARRNLVKKTALILQKFDEMEKGNAIMKMSPTEEDIKRSPPRTEVDEIESLIAARRRELGETKHTFCSHCGRVVKGGDQYCVHCGEKITS